MRTLFLLLIAINVLASCARKAGQTADEAGLIGAAEKDIFQATGYPIVSEPITLKTIVNKRPINGPFEEMPTITRWEKKAGINLEIQEIPQSSYKDKVKLLFASDDLPDIIMGEASVDLTDYADASARRLDEYINTYMPNLKGILDQRPQYRKVMQEANGHIYSLISIEEFVERKIPSNAFINKTWLDRLGLEVPQTTEEFYQVLKLFKEGDPNQNGINDEIPLSYDGGWRTGGDFFNLLSGSFVDVLLGSPPLFVENGKIVCTPLAEPEGFKELVLYIQRLYQEGLIDVEAYTQDRSQYFAKGAHDPEILGTFSEWHPGYVVGADRVDDYTALPPLAGPSGRKEWPSNQKAYYRRGIFVLPTSNPYPASTMRFIDMAYDPEYAWQIMYGPWDILLNRDTDGQITTNPPPEGQSPDEFRYQYTPATRFPYGLLIDAYDKFTPSIAQQQKIERAKDVYLPYADESKYVPDMSFTKDEKEEWGVLRSDLRSVYASYLTKWVLEGEDPVADWDDFAEQMKKAGIERYIEIYQTVYERYQNP